MASDATTLRITLSHKQYRSSGSLSDNMYISTSWAFRLRSAFFLTTLGFVLSELHFLLIRSFQFERMLSTWGILLFPWNLCDFSRYFRIMLKYVWIQLRSGSPFQMVCQADICEQIVRELLARARCVAIWSRSQGFSRMAAPISFLIISE